ncbi:glycosyltransferase family 2 protein [candidate division KSB1 bacterium]|nr:MAG: glycosyltransferase family 2 protein [candidate division KSB1 bacterium]
MIVAAIIFWLCLAAMLHTYVTYPLSLRLFRRRYAVPPVMPDGAWPRVAVLIPAYNEEQVIGAKIENSLALDYDPALLEILVGSDGSTDRTDEIVRGFSDPCVQLIRLSGRSGKTGVLNRLVAESSADILVFSDANVTLDRAALRLLVRHFADPLVGGVNGGKYIRIPEGAESVKGEEIYGDLENRLRTLESEIGGTSGALGSLMAVRRELYRSYAPGSINDDTVPSLWIMLAGYRNVHDPAAKAFEESGFSIREEFRRRIRIGAGNYQTLFRYRNVLSPRYGIAAYTYFSHKALRWLFPFWMLGALLANLFLLENPFYQWTLTCQLAGYGAGWVGGMADLAGIRLPILTALYHFIALNIAFLIGFVVYLRGIRSAAWERTAREEKL